MIVYSIIITILFIINIIMNFHNEFNRKFYYNKMLEEKNRELQYYIDERNFWRRACSNVNENKLN